MKFYGNGVVWDAKANKALCRFDKTGELETEDETIRARLIELGYKHDPVIITEPTEEPAKDEAEEIGDSIQQTSDELFSQFDAKITKEPAAKSTEKVVSKK